MSTTPRRPDTPTPNPVIDWLLRVFSPVRRRCARVDELLSLEADGLASDAEKKFIAQHIERCPECRAQQAVAAMARLELTQRPRAVMTDALATRMAALMAEEHRRENVAELERRRSRPGQLRAALGVASAVILFAAVLLHSQHGSTPIVSNSGTPVRPGQVATKLPPANNNVPVTPRATQPFTNTSPNSTVASNSPVVSQPEQPSVVHHHVQPSRVTTPAEAPQVVAVLPTNPSPAETKVKTGISVVRPHTHISTSTQIAAAPHTDLPIHVEQPTPTPNNTPDQTAELPKTTAPVESAPVVQSPPPIVATTPAPTTTVASAIIKDAHMSLADRLGLKSQSSGSGTVYADTRSVSVQAAYSGSLSMVSAPVR